MKTKFNDDLFRLCHPVGQLRELNRRADLGAIEEKLEHLRRVKGLRMTENNSREFARTNNPTELSCACKHLIADEVPAFCDEEE